MGIAKKVKIHGPPMVNPVIPLDHPDWKALKQGEYIAFKCHSTPGETTSPTYEVQTLYSSSGLPEEWIIFTYQLAKGIHGQDITIGPGCFGYILCLLTCNAKTKDIITPHKVANFDTALQAMAKHIFPTHTYCEQKRYLRRYLKKPTDMKVRKCVTRIVKVNSFFVHFPSETGKNCGSLHKDEAKEIIYHSLFSPRRKQIILQGFNYVEQIIDFMVNFLEERVENWEPT